MFFCRIHRFVWWAVAASLFISGVAGIALSSFGKDLGKADFFETHRVCSIQIEIAPENVEALRKESRTYVRATVRALGQIYQNVGVHLKGSTGSFRSLEDKPGFTLDFARFVHNQRFHGLTKIHLNNSVEDPSYLKEQLGAELFRAARIPGPRVAHARVELNGRPLGFYVLKEGFTVEFLGRSFERAGGNLYDTDQGHDVDLPMKRHLGLESSNDQSGLQRLAAAAREPDPDRRWKRLQQTLDVDLFLTFMAVEIMICHWDGYCLGRNNFRIYQNPGGDRMVFLPSGMDQIFSKADLPWMPDMAGLVARAIMEVPEGRRLYAAKFKTLVHTLFESGPLTNRVRELVAELRPFLPAGDFATLRQEADALCSQIAQREIYLRQKLNEPERTVLEFRHGTASLSGWEKAIEPVQGILSKTDSPDGKPSLKILAGPSAFAAWRTTVRLSPGRYRFQGKAKVIDVIPLPFGKNQGACLRMAGSGQRSSHLTGTTDWETLETEFRVEKSDTEVGLVCELRASAGVAWFDTSSLTLFRLK